MKHQILLYYKYVTIEDPVSFMNEQRALCERLELKGRIIVAEEGINGTVEGTLSSTEAYIEEMNKDERFSDMWYKKSEGTGNAFPKLSVKVRPEIVSSYWGKEIDPSKETGKYLSADELHEWFEEKKEFYIVDMRNDYEHVSGHFQDSLLPDLANFRDLREEVKNLEHLKDKTVLTVCTGGVRCEKASAFLLKHGFTDVYQLHGGIVSYMEKYPNQHFKGQLYVFDGRVTMGFNVDDPDREIVGRCQVCDQPSEHYINCANLNCHVHIICCDECCDENGQGYCKECREKFATSNLGGQNQENLVK